MSSNRRSKGAFLDAVEGVTGVGMWYGGGAFIIISGYVLYGILSGSMAKYASLQQADQLRILNNVLLSCKVLTITGVVAILGAAIRHYADEITGYMLLISGAVLHWGAPMLIGSSVQNQTLSTIAAQLPFHIASTYKMVGILSLGIAAPFILVDFWLKMRGERRDISTRPARKATVVAKDEKQVVPKNHFYICCWHMPYCREYLRSFCKAYEQRKSCWRVKSGCYCDEDMILRVMKNAKTAKVAGFDQRFSGVAGTGKSLGGSEKRDRCRQCFLYQEHQKQKYRLLSPLAFPATVILMWMYLQPVKAVLGKALSFTDKFAGSVTYGHGQAVGNQWANAPVTSETVLWMFLICTGLIIVTYVLRGIEYAIFDMQI